jgi:hypothetical protein
MEMWSRASDRKDQVCSYDLLFGLKDGTEDIFFLHFTLFFFLSNGKNSPCLTFILVLYM